MLTAGVKGALWLAFSSVVAALGQESIISTSAHGAHFQIAGGHVGKGQILVSSNDYWGVIRAAGDLAVDFGRVTGTNYTLSNGERNAAPATYTYHPVNNKNNTYYSTTGTANFTGPAYADPDPEKVVIIAGTIGHSKVIDKLIASRSLDVSRVKGKWESFTSQLVKNPVPGCKQALVVAGSDPRGTIYGIYDISEQIGVSPWYFWADSPPRKHKNLYVTTEKKVQGPPSVKYRGFFLNDEQPALTNWVASHWQDTPYGPGYGAAFYGLIYELLLRLRANYLWPAIWATMFEVDDPANQPLADAFEVVIGSSHTEPLMRAQNEFGHFYEGPWAYNLNNKTIDDYFRYGVQRAKPYARNSLWTMGMRGTGDTAIEGLGVEYIVEMLQTLVKNQREIMAEGLGIKDITTVPQMWCLYKEVMSYLSAGLQVPDDVTLLWADDNWGNVRRLPLRNETQRHGGAGIYYHFDYVGGPRDYKWINTIQLTKTAEQMHMAYARGADRIWIVNVGDMKALEIPISHFFDLGYDAERWHVDSTQEWAEAWAAREFGPARAREIADVMMKYGMYAARRKYELVEPWVYSVINYNEAEAVLQQWAELVADAQAIYDELPAEAKPAFFQTVLHPALAGEIVHQINVGGARNMLYAGQKRNAANKAIQDVLAYSAADANLTRRWDALLDGKWKHFMDQTHLGYDGYWQQPMRNALPPMVYVQTDFTSLAGEIGIGVEGSNATVKGDDRWHANSGNDLTLPPLDPYGPATRYIDIFSRGPEECSWTLSSSKPWLKLSQSTGVVGPNHPDARVLVSVDWKSAPPAPYSDTVQINITTPCTGMDRYGFGDPHVLVPVTVRSVPKSFKRGFVESDGNVAFAAEHYSRIVEPASKGKGKGKGQDEDVTYHTFASYGRTSSGVGLVPLGAEKLAREEAPALEYDLYLFTNTSAANVTLYLSPALNYLGDATPLEYAVALFPASSAGPEPDDDAVVVKHVQPVGATEGGNMPDGWDGAVADGVWGLTGGYTTSSFEVAREGAYKLRVWALMPGVVVQKVVVDLGGVRPSYLGPPESFLVGRDRIGARNGTSFLG
ncbi:glycoside hydrolase family 115 protein [Thermothelomyces heterothallicus CBS 202.75]|uniref:glycoside hydrolase family 115 protein n=1 Tax=Thermothelomyces heterothallicus CBS 202.75 TaxID=1149848 RepID=UPI0037421E2D